MSPLTKVNQEGVVKLTNISLRKMVVVELPVARENIRHYAYIPYEVLASLGSAYTPSSDMYAVGLMMWEMWTGLLAYYEEVCSYLAITLSECYPINTDNQNMTRPSLI